MKEPLPPILSLPVPLLLMASVVVVSVLGWIIKPLQRALILSPFLVRRGQVHRLLTSGWVHADVSHLLFNMVSLYLFAEPVLRALGATLFLTLYVSAVVMASIPTTLRHMRDPKYGSLGASGAVAAVMFSAILLNPRMKLYLMVLPIPLPAPLFAVGYLAYSAYRSYRAGDDINHDAHFSGAIYGAIFTYGFASAQVARALKGLF
ncbi:MAG: rhomboid family intramembrane serine protease [Minicystis sp.]